MWDAQGTPGGRRPQKPPPQQWQQRPAAGPASAAVAQQAVPAPEVWLPQLVAPATTPLREGAPNALTVPPCRIGGPCRKSCLAADRARRAARKGAQRRERAAERGLSASGPSSREASRLRPARLALAARTISGLRMPGAAGHAALAVERQRVQAS